MLPKHSKDIVFIVIILLLIGVIWGVPKEFWILIAVNVIVIMVGILYVKLNGVIENSNIKVEAEEEKFVYEKVENTEDTYERLKEIAEEEADEFLEEANYENFGNVIRGKEIAESFVEGKIELNEALKEIRGVCKFKLQAYYLGLSFISMADTEKMSEKDYDYIALGVKIVNSINLENGTKLLKFLRNTKLKIND